MSHFLQKVTESLMERPYSLMIDESNDKTDKSSIILMRFLFFFYTELGNVCTRFLDMPIVDIGSAQNLFLAVKSSLEKKDLDFSMVVSFMSDTTNVMKGCKCGVQKLMKDENPSIHDIGCIYHLVDLTVKAGLKTLPFDIHRSAFCGHLLLLLS